MANTHAAINPMLIATLTGEPLSGIPNIPTVKWLPGKLAKLIAKHKKKISPPFEANKMMLICGHCGRKGQYDLGLIAFNVGHGRSNSQDQHESMFDHIQTTGYFRCKQCNGAGLWETKDPFLLLSWLLKATAGEEEDSSSFMIGQIQLYDGTTPRWATDAEDNFLKKLGENSQDGYLWNRLGNLYSKGGRPELAAAAYEKSIEVDPTQVESYYSLGQLLIEVDEPEAAAYHYRMMLVYARNYSKLPILDLRKMLAIGLWHSFDIHMKSGHNIPFIPTKEELEALDSFKEAAAGAEHQILELQDLEVFPDDPESFYPIAEMYLGPRKEEIPPSERTLDTYLRRAKQGGMKPASDRLATPLGKGDNSIVAYVRSEERAGKILRLCDRYGLPCIVEINYMEDLSDLRKALMQKLTPSNVYASCPCGSGQKFKFCCAAKLKHFDLEQWIGE